MRKFLLLMMLLLGPAAQAKVVTKRSVRGRRM